MKMTIVGKGQRRSGKSSKSGKEYDFTAIYCIRAANGVEGHLAEEISFNHRSSLVFPDVHVGDVVNVSYDKNGFLEDFSVIEKAGKPATENNLKINRPNT